MHLSKKSEDTPKQMKKRIEEILKGGNWDRKVYQDECYTIHMLGGNPYMREERIGRRRA